MPINKSTIRNGMQIEKPNVLIPWDITEQEFVKLLSNISIEKTLVGYAFDAEVFKEKLELHLDFTFYDRLQKVMLWRPLDFYEGKDFEMAGLESFKELQSILELSFGKPNLLGYLGIPLNYKHERHFTWNERDVRIEHSYSDSVRGFTELLEFKIK